MITSRTRWRRLQIEGARFAASVRIAQRLRELPRRARMLLSGLDNAENDPTLLFEGLPYDGVAAAALGDVDVREAVATLPAGFNRWS